MYKRKKPRYFIHSTRNDFADLYSSKNTLRQGFSKTFFFLITLFALVGSASVYGFSDNLPEFDIAVDTQVFHKSIAKGLAVFSDSEDTENNTQEKKSDKEISHKRMYTVQAGDTLWSIAQKFYKSGYNWVDIAKANNIELSHLISEGMELVIPEVDKKFIAQADTAKASYSYEWDESTSTATSSAISNDSPSEPQQTTTTSTTTTTQSSGTSEGTPSNIGTSQPSSQTASPTPPAEPTPTASPTPAPTSTDTPPEACDLPDCTPVPTPTASPTPAPTSTDTPPEACDLPDCTPVPTPTDVIPTSIL